MDDNIAPVSGENGAETNRRRIITPPPIDLEHLSRQTLGDDGVAREVLSLFLLEIGSARAVIGADRDDERRELAHRLKGAARAIGAFALAETAADMEQAPDRDDVVADFLSRISELETFISDHRNEL